MAPHLPAPGAVPSDLPAGRTLGLAQLDPVPAVLRTYEAASWGVSRHALSTSAWQQVSHGLHAAPRTLDDVRLHAEALARVLPSPSAFAHITGASLREWALPWTPSWMPVMAATTGSLHVQRAGTYVRRLRGRPVDLVGALPVLSTAALLLDLACDLELVDLVCVVDGALRAEGLPAARVLEALPPGAHGAPRLRTALAFSDARAESPRETVLRLLHRVAGILVEVQVPVGEGDGPVARADLLLTGTRRLVEYDGAEHRRKERQRHDLARDRAIQRAGWERYGYSDDDLVRRPGTVLRDAADALGLPHDPRRLARWLPHARRSVLTPSGRHRLEQRYARYVRAAVKRQPE